MALKRFQSQGVHLSPYDGRLVWDGAQSEQLTVVLRTEDTLCRSLGVREEETWPSHVFDGPPGSGLFLVVFAPSRLMALAVAKLAERERPWDTWR